ncbi:LysE family translocator [Desulfurobacterium sp.]
MLKVAVTLFIVWTLLLLTPGPDFILVMKNTISGGYKNGFLTILGITAGIVIHTITAVFGICLLSKNPTAFNIVKTAGALYLVYIGVSGFLQLKKKSQNLHINKDKRTLQPGKSFREGFFCNILNPKLPLILLGIFTQLIPPRTPTFTKLLFGAEIVATSFVMWNAVSLFFGSRRVLDRILRFEKEIMFAANLVLILLGGYELIFG